MPFLRAARSGLLAAVALLGAASLGLPAVADDAQRQRVTQEWVVEATGDIRLVHTVKLPLRAYTALRDEVRNTALLLRRLGVGGQQALVFRDARAEYDDAESSVRLTARLVGGAKSRGDLWHVTIEDAAGQEVIDQAPDRIRLLSVGKLADGTDQVVTASLVFPPGTKGVRFNPTAGRVEAAMPPPPSVKGAPAVLALELESRPELMSSFHKLYGQPAFTNLWAARAEVVNRGAGAARDFAVRFRVEGYSEWSPWQRSGWLHPGQTVVEAYHPLLSRAVLDLTAQAPAQLELEWTATGPDGAALRGAESRPITLLGMNDVVWSSLPAHEATSWSELFDQAPLVAATFVSHTDPVVQRFAGMAAGLSGGVPAAADDASAKRYMQAVYELMAGNRIAYQTPPGLLKENLRQHVKFARDVLRNRSGTCIDLAILFASTCQAAGLHPLLVFVPGHAFPAVRLPSGEVQPLESTAISVAPTGQALPFAKALELGEQNFERALERGAYLLCDVLALRALGLAPPELPALAGDPLADWGIVPQGLEGAGGPPSATEGRWKHPSGAFSLVAPPGWVVTAVENGADLQSQDPDVVGQVRMLKRRDVGTTRALAEDVGLKATQLEEGRAIGRQVRSHAEGLMPDQRHPRSSLGCSMSSGGRAFSEDFHVTLAREHGFLLYLRWPTDQAAARLPALRALVASFVIHEEPAPPRPPEIHRQPDGTLTCEIPSGWSAQVDEGGVLRLAVRTDLGSLAIRTEPRHPDIRTADRLADDLTVFFTREQAKKGARVEVLSRSRELGAGARLAITYVVLRVTNAQGRLRKHQIGAVLGARTMTFEGLDAPDELWALWIPSFNQVLRSLKIDDEPLPGADAVTSGAPSPPQPDSPPAERPRPDAAPPRSREPEPPALPEVPLEVYEDPAGLFRMQLPKGWRIEGQPLGVSAVTLSQDAIVSLTLGPREGESHDAFVARVLARMPSSFQGWKELSRAVGGGDGVERTTRLEGRADGDGTPMQMVVDLTTTRHFHQMLVLACPRARGDVFAPLWEAVLSSYGPVTGGWPEERPLVRLRAVASARMPYTLEVPSNWRVEPAGLDVVARSVQGDALVAARAAPRAHESIDALGAALLERIAARGQSVQVLAQEVREEGGRSVLVARVRDELAGVPWERDIMAFQTETHDVHVVLATRSDVRFKWEQILARVAGSWAPRP